MPPKGNTKLAGGAGAGAVIGYPKFSKVDHANTQVDSDPDAAARQPGQADENYEGGDSDNDQQENVETLSARKKRPGYPINRKEVEEAFKYFDVSGKKKLAPKDLKKRLSVFYPNMSNKEYKFLISETTFTMDTLMGILESNSLQNFDPMEEAFKVFDPHNTGYVDEKALRRIMTGTGHGDISDEDLKVLLEVADVDKDGRISFTDFVNMITAKQQPQNGGASSSGAAGRGGA